MFVTRITAPHRVVSLPFLSALGYINAVLSPLVSGDPAGATVATLSVQNTDDASFTWSLIDDAGGAFDINPTTGDLTTTAAKAQSGVYVVVVQAVGSPSGETFKRKLVFVIEAPSSFLEFLMLAEGLVEQELYEG